MNPLLARMRDGQPVQQGAVAAALQGMSTSASGVTADAGAHVCIQCRWWDLIACRCLPAALFRVAACGCAQAAACRKMQDALARLLRMFYDTRRLLTSSARASFWIADTRLPCTQVLASCHGLAGTAWLHCCSVLQRPARRTATPPAHKMLTINWPGALVHFAALLTMSCCACRYSSAALVWLAARGCTAAAPPRGLQDAPARLLRPIS